jgi:hypothetical protein
VPFILADDLELIIEQLQGFAGYDFASDLGARMKTAGLAPNKLASRAAVSHVTVGKWLSGAAKPHGKERFKELGMALGMNEPELNAFLNANCYPRLYMKNPLDVACRFVLSKSAGDARVVNVYRDFLTLYKLDAYVLSDSPADISTGALSRGFENICSTSGFEGWLRENDQHFRAFDKIYIPHLELIWFIILYIGDQSVNGMYIAGQLPKTIRNLLYPLLADREIAVRGLRSKLIIYGLYENMNEDEINVMLETAKLRPVTSPSSRADCAVLTSLRCAHERYPYYELANAEKILKAVAENGSGDMIPFREFYKRQQRRAAEYVNYYENGGHKSEADRLFEESYTGLSVGGVLKYTQDILTLLRDGGALADGEAADYLTLMEAYLE